MAREHLQQKAAQLFDHRFGHAPAAVAVAPGRVNLIGEHGGDDDGYVLPLAIDRYVAAAFAPRADRVLRVYSAEFQQMRELSLEALDRRTESAPDRRSGRGGWFGYLAGVAWALAAAGYRLRGADVAIVSDLPVDAGLSSSAALEIATSRALVATAEIEWVPHLFARFAQRAEREFAGVDCGIMDQLSAAVSKEGCALLVDCRSLDTRDVPVPEDARIVVFDSGVRAESPAGEYAARRGSCTRVVAALRKRYGWVHALRDADDALIAEVAAELDAIDVRRASHVVAENRRALELANAFAGGDLERAGRVLMHSHASLRDLYEVSSPDLDTLVELALEQPGCTGARLTGLGFGGCIVALVEAGSVERVMSSVETGYEARRNRATTAFVTRASAGATVVNL
jgi:galactokinase